ncbi:hypothetical protein K461DRAFT_268535 [Myriangium duriaei CBS 260.36]|uniref:Uncharacterized protein n=1 Tax=Myriangium duriaei CBS 260.36 TaxID=1168546 RepID=A0A9P4J0V8_9PEZI|nr:hypothetical protein K461DRAFT_268535 [Myriangium duriaei CBS 260.36]
MGGTTNNMSSADHDGDELPPYYSGGPDSFPDVLHVYRTRHSARELYLGQRENESWRAISSYHGFNFTKTGVHLHEGATPDSLVVATCGADGRIFSSKDRVTVASPPAPAPIYEEFKITTKVVQLYQFAILVPGHDEKFLTHFEWRRLHETSDTKELADNVHDLKLIMYNRDGSEDVVAELIKTPNIATRIGTFKFIGHAAHGGLGPGFSAAVVVTALRIWQTRYLLEDQQKHLAAGGH